MATHSTELVVQKFGGSSLSTLAQIAGVAEHVASEHRIGRRVVAVVSARGDTTDDLLRLAQEVAGPVLSAVGRETDQLLVTGEAASAALLAMALHRLGVPATSLMGAQTGILAVGPHGAAAIDRIDVERIRRLLAGGRVVVVGGFHGTNAEGDAVTLGRGGSDTTAVALAVALGADRCEIYSDVDGVYTADPRDVPGARRLDVVHRWVMAELAFAGARVLHPRSVELAGMHGLDLHLHRAASPGTGTIVAGRDEGALETRSAVEAVTVDADVARILVRSEGDDLAPLVIGLLARRGVPVDLVARSGPQEDEFRMGFTVRGTDLARIRGELEDLARQRAGVVRVDTSVAKVSVVGMGLLDRPEHLARMTAVLAEAGIPVSWVSMSQLRVSTIVPDDRCREAVRLLHDEFGLDQVGADREPSSAGRTGAEDSR